VVIGEAEDSSPYFLPMKMGTEALREGWKKAWKEFNSFLPLETLSLEYSPTCHRFVYFPFSGCSTGHEEKDLEDSEGIVDKAMSNVKAKVQ